MPPSILALRLVPFVMSETGPMPLSFIFFSLLQAQQRALDPYVDLGEGVEQYTRSDWPISMDVSAL